MVGRFWDGFLDVVYQRKTERSRKYYSPRQNEANVYIFRPRNQHSTRRQSFKKQTAADVYTVEEKLKRLEEFCDASVPDGQEEFLQLDGIQLEKYFRRIGRTESEEILKHSVAGTCLVRPYKLEDDRIKYILSVVYGVRFFHLHIREKENGKFAVGKERVVEDCFDSPIDIINYYSEHKLLCSNDYATADLLLKPLQ